MQILCCPLRVYSSRQSIRLRWGLHCQQRRPGGHGALLCGRFHLHYCPPSDGLVWSPGVCPGAEEPRGAGAPPGSPEERQTHEAAAHGQRPACGQLPQPHHPHTGEFSSAKQTSTASCENNNKSCQTFFASTLTFLLS